MQSMAAATSSGHASSHKGSYSPQLLPSLVLQYCVQEICITSSAAGEDGWVHHEQQKYLQGLSKAKRMQKQE